MSTFSSLVWWSFLTLSLAAVAGILIHKRIARGRVESERSSSPLITVSTATAEETSPFLRHRNPPSALVRRRGNAVTFAPQQEMPYKKSRTSTALPVTPVVPLSVQLRRKALQQTDVVVSVVPVSSPQSSRPLVTNRRRRVVLPEAWLSRKRQRHDALWAAWSTSATATENKGASIGKMRSSTPAVPKLLGATSSDAPSFGAPETNNNRGTQATTPFVFGATTTTTTAPTTPAPPPQSLSKTSIVFGPQPIAPSVTAAPATGQQPAPQPAFTFGSTPAHTPQPGPVSVVAVATPAPVTGAPPAAAPFGSSTQAPNTTTATGAPPVAPFVFGGGAAPANTTAPSAPTPAAGAFGSTTQTGPNAPTFGATAPITGPPQSAAGSFVFGSTAPGAAPVATSTTFGGGSTGAAPVFGAASPAGFGASSTGGLMTGSVASSRSRSRRSSRRK